MTPISFDGDDVSEITIDGDQVTEVTMDGDVVWTAEPAVAIVDSFEHDDISTYYSGHTSNYDINDGGTTVDAIDGSLVLENPTTSFQSLWSNDDDGLDNYPQEDETWRCWWYSNGSTSIVVRVMWAMTNESHGTNPNNAYVAEAWVGGDLLAIAERENDSFSRITNTSHTYSADTWYAFEVTWESNGDIELNLLDDSETVLETLTANDTRLSGEYGVAFRTNDPCFIDYYHIV